MWIQSAVLRGLSLTFMLLKPNSCVNSEKTLPQRQKITINLVSFWPLAVECLWEHKNKCLLSPTACLSICVHCYSFCDWYKRDHMTQQSICRNQSRSITELSFTLVQCQRYAQWIYSKTLTRRRNNKSVV